MDVGRVARLGVVALALVTVGTAAVGASTSAAALGPFNPDWNGGQELRTVAESGPRGPVALQSASGYPADGEAVVLALSPDAPGEAGRDRAARFVRQGGTLVVADDGSGAGNELLSAVGASARIDGTLLRDEHRYGPSPAFPVATNVTDHRFTRGVDALVLDAGSAVDPGDASVLVGSSGFAYLDRNDDGSPNDGERLRSHPVVTVEAVGDGTVVAVSDSSLFLNAMIDRRDNRAFAEALVSDRERVVIDAAGHDAAPPLAAASRALRGSAFVQIWVALVGLRVLYVATRPRTGSGGRPSILPRWAVDRFDPRADGSIWPNGLVESLGVRVAGEEDASPPARGPPATATANGGSTPAESPTTGRSAAPDPDRASADEATAGDGSTDRDRPKLGRVTEAIITRSEMRANDD